MGRIVLFKGESSYDALNVFIDGLADAFRHLAYDPIVVDFRHPDKVNRQIEHAWSEPCKFAFGFNGIGIDLTSNGKSIYDSLDTLYIGHMVDHPIYHLSFYYEVEVKNKIFLFADREHIHFIKHFFPKLNAGFLTQAGCLPQIPMNVQSTDNWEKRDIDLLFVGTIHNFKQIREKWLEYPKPLSTLFDETAEHLIGDETLSLESAFRITLEDWGYYPNKQLLYRFTAYFQEIDIYVRSYKRYHCLKTLAESDCRIRCYTNRPDIPMIPKRKGFSIFPAIPMPEIFPLMARSRIVLNIIPGYIDGAHERIFSSMLCGAVSLSDSTRYLNQRFTHGRNILFFSFHELDQLNDGIEQFMADPAKLFSIAQSGKEKALLNHTWENRASQIIELAKINQLMKSYDQALPF